MAVEARGFVPEEALGPKNNEKKLEPEIAAVFDKHIADVATETIGNRELSRQLGADVVGAVAARVDRPHPALDIELLRLQKGTVKILIGPNGAGKSTLFDAITHNQAALGTDQGKGAVVYGASVHERPRLRIARLNQEEMLREIGHRSSRYVLDEAVEHFKREFPRDWEEWDGADQEYADRIPADEAARIRLDALRNNVIKLLEMDDFLDRPIAELSGGEKTKLTLALLFSSEPDVVLLDEPTNHLDLPSIAKLLARFEKYRAAEIPVVASSHVEWFCRESGRDGVWEISWDEKGRHLNSSSSPYSSFVRDRSRAERDVIDGTLTWPAYEPKKGAVVSFPHKLKLPDSPHQETHVPNVIGGDVILLTGKNGSGKTRLLEAMVGPQKPGYPTREKGTTVAYLPQSWPEEVQQGSVTDFLRWFKDRTNRHDIHFDNVISKRLKEVRFGGSSERAQNLSRTQFSKLSGGEQRLLWFIAASSIEGVDGLVLDEPTNHMDQKLQAIVTRLLREFPGAIVVSTHDRILMENLAKDGGKIHGQVRKPTHWILDKKDGKSSLAVSKEDPVSYVGRLIDEGKRAARQFKIS